MLALLTKFSNMSVSLLKHLSNEGGEMEETAKKVDTAIKAYVKADGRSYEWLAGQLGMSAVSLYNKRTGRTDWTWSEILALCKVIGTTPSKFA